VQFIPQEPNRHEYAIDGSDSANNATFDPQYFAEFADTPYYRFQAWLRDEGSYSNWRSLVIRDLGEEPLLRQARPVPGEEILVPSEFELAVDLRRIEVQRAIDFRTDGNGLVRLEINRNDKYVRLLSIVPEEPPTELARWYFAREWLPELANVIYLLLRTCALALFLFALLVPFAMLLPNWVPRLRGKIARSVVLGLILTVALASSFYTSVVLFDMMPHIYDAQSYYFQAKIFAAGMLYAPAPPSAEAFDVPFDVVHDGKWFSMYTPGASLVLALGVKAGAAWLVGPLLATGGVLLTYVTTARLFTGRTALLAAALMASSPFLHLQAGSFMSHVPGMFWGLLVLLAAVRYSEQRTLRWAITGAAALGCLFLTRELSAIVYAATIGSYVAWRSAVTAWRLPSERRRFVADVAGAGLCLALFALAYLLYNWALTGSPTLLPRVLFSPQENSYGFGDGVGFYGRHTLGGGLVNADEMLTSLGITLFGWPYSVALALIALPFLLRRATTWERVLGALAIGFVIAYIGLYYHGITYGPRYYLDALPALVILAARGFVALAATAATLGQDIGRRHARPRAELATLLLCAVLFACNITYFWPQQSRVHKELAKRPGQSSLTLGNLVERRVEGRVAAVPNGIVVTRDWGLLSILGPLNCPRLDCATVFAYSPNESADAQLRAAFPGRNWYKAHNVNGVLTLETFMPVELPLQP
jgi:4-amino-4-deoxy-L-arabinose transferase-like glycosyltransferase